MHDVTDRVAAIVTESGVQTGTAQIFNVGSTGAMGTIEFEPGLQRDLPEILDKLIPPSQSYGHEQAWHDGNGHSHLQATWLGPSISVPVAAVTMLATDAEIQWDQRPEALVITLPNDLRSEHVVAFRVSFQ